MANRWVLGARPRTLPAAVAPVVAGTAVAVHEGGAVWWKAALALVVGLALQVATNYANDYSDGVRGTDDARVGPARLVAGGLASPAAVKRAALAAFAVAAAAGLVLAATTAWWLVAVGAACVAAGWYYTGGSRPYGYAGLGELAVFVFFGLVATAGTAFVQTERVTALAVACGAAMGALACALLVVNNLRDIPTDLPAGKRTLAVRLGDRRTRALYAALVLAGPLVAAGAAAGLGGAGAWALLVLAAYAGAGPAVAVVAGGAAGRELVAALGLTSRAQLALAAALAVTLVASR